MTRLTRKTTIAITAALLALGGLTGCGDDASTDQAPAPTETTMMSESPDAMMSESPDAMMSESPDAMMSESPDEMMSETP